MGLRFPLRKFGPSIRKVMRKPPVELEPVEAYDLWAASYDDSGDNALLHVEASVVDELMERIDIRGKFVLDAGCGTGRRFRRILERRPRLLAGVDLSQNMLQQASTKVSNEPSASIQVADVRHLPFRDGLFDCVVSALVLDHIPELEIAVNEISRVLRSGGTLIISSFHPFGKLLSWKRTFQAEVRPGHKEWCAAQYHLHLYADYFSALKAACMDILEVYEPVIDERVRPFYERAGRLDLFRRFQGFPMLLVLVARKT